MQKQTQFQLSAQTAAFTHRETAGGGGTDTQLRVLSQISAQCDITKGRDPEQCLLSGTHSLKSGVNNGSGGWTFVIFMEFADRQGHRLIIENHW